MGKYLDGRTSCQVCELGYLYCLKLKISFIIFKTCPFNLLQLNAQLAGNMMSQGQRGSKGQRQEAAINGSLNKNWS